jgi:membrane-anchored protein YejM (alkaline phosphatase superfamily)
MVVHWPGKTGAHIKYRTENFDIAPTLMTEVLGFGASPASTYATGNGMFSQRQRDWSIAHSYMGYALLLDDLNIVRTPSGDVDVIGNDMQRITDYTLKPGTTKQVLDELSRFYK